MLSGKHKNPSPHKSVLALGGEAETGRSWEFRASQSSLRGILSEGNGEKISRGRQRH